MMNSGRMLIATIAGFAALGLALLALLYWAIIADPPLNFDLARMDTTMRVLMVAAIISFSGYLLATPESITRAAGKRSNRLTVNAIVAAAVAVAIAIAINIIAENVGAVRADWTANKSFSLSQQTINVLKALETRNANVSAVAFYNPRDGNQQQMEDLLKEYTSHTSRFKYEFVDPVAAPSKAAQYGVTRAGSVVFAAGAKSEVAANISEADFTGALVRLAQTGVKTVAFLTGHGERDPQNGDTAGYSQVWEAVKKDNYNAISWSLTTSPTITLDQVEVLVIAEPQRPLSDNELSAVRGYLDAGGHVLMLLDPRMPTNALRSLAFILQKYGVTPMQGAVVDFQNTVSQQDPTFLALSQFPTADNPITRDFGRTSPLLFPLSLGLQPPTSTGDLAVTSILQSSVGEQVSWLETDFTPENRTQVEIRYDGNKDIPGPVTMGLTIGPAELAASPTQTDTNTVKTRLVVYGDADFPSNGGVIQDAFNSDLFANSVSWLAGANELVSIRPKDPEAPRTMTLDAGQQRVVLFSSVIGLPVLVLLLGTFIWWRRR